MIAIAEQPPDPRAVRTVADFIHQLAALRALAGQPSYQALADRINQRRADAIGSSVRALPDRLARSTVADCFTRLNRRRLDYELVFEIIRVLGVTESQIDWWLQAWQAVFGPSDSAALVRVGRSLPDGINDFTGRTEEIAFLVGGSHRNGDEPPTTMVWAIEGMAGIGKTQLAIRAAHELLSQGWRAPIQLYVNLHGFDPEWPPAEPAAVLESCLRALGMHGNHIPLDLAGRTRAYRNLVRAGPALLVLDNAANDAQVRPLLPDNPSSLVFVTSRRRLDGLPDAHHLRLTSFSRAESLDLLSRTSGPGQVEAEPEAADRIAQACGDLPLAVSLVAHQIKARAGWTLTDHASRIEALRLEDGIRRALVLSYEHLSGTHQRVLRLLALHPGADFTVYAAAALGDTDVDTAQRHLDTLVTDHLLLEAEVHRYHLHDLVRAYAVERLLDEEPGASREAALTRLFDNYLGTAAMAMDLIAPHEKARRPAVAVPGTPTVSLADDASATGWLDSERHNLLATAIPSAYGDRPTHTVRLSATLWRYLDTGGHYADALTLHERAVTAARLQDDPAGEVRALTSLGNVHLRLSNYIAAAELYEQALDLSRDTGDRLGQANVLGNLGVVYVRIGSYEQATDRLGQALALYRETGNKLGQANSLGNLGFVSARRGRYEEALEYHRRALSLHCDVGNRVGEANALGNLGFVLARIHRYDQSTDHYQQALVLHAEIGDRAGQAETLTGLGVVCHRLGELERAIDYHRQALTLAEEIGDRESQAAASNGYGEAARAAGDPTGALSAHSRAHARATEIGDRMEQARAHEGLGHSYRDLDDYQLAGQQWQQALDLYTELGVPEADRVRAKLAELHEQTG